MEKKPFTVGKRIIGLTGLSGVAFLLLGVILPAIAYRGRAGEPYSFLNHFISELGEVGVSRFAAVFNACLVLGGIALVPFCLFLGLSLRRNPWAKLAMVAGIASSIFCSLVGFFPMNHLESHMFIAMGFFRLGLVMILLFTIAIFAQHRESRIVPLWVTWAGLLSAASFAVFLFVVPRFSGFPGNLLDPAVYPARPSPLPLAVSEWSILLTTLAWILIVSASLAVPSARKEPGRS